MKDKKMDPVDLLIKFNRDDIQGFLDKGRGRSLTSTVIGPIYLVSDTYNNAFESSGYQERIILMVLPVTSEISEAAEGCSLKHHTIRACRDVVNNKGVSHG